MFEATRGGALSLRGELRSIDDVPLARMFFVTLLLNEVVAWMRGQSGTSSLRALLYMDVRYEGGTHGVTGFAEPDLVLTDDIELIRASFRLEGVSRSASAAQDLIWRQSL